MERKGVINMSNKIKPTILPGFMELLPREQVIFNDIVSKITKVYESNGCMPMDTPIIKKEEVLLAKSAGETEKQVYRVSKGERQQVLRFDLTVPVSRYVAQYMNDLTFPFKRYQVGKVYRGERNQRGRYREFYQCDVDIIGNGKLSIKNDALVISMVSQAFKNIGLGDYKFQVSNRKILAGLLQELEVKDKQGVMSLIDKYDKMGKEACLSELKNLVGEKCSKVLQEFMELKGTNEEILAILKNKNICNETYKNGIKELQEVMECLNIFGVKEDEYKINLKIIRGLDYYTGTIFETLLEGYEFYGSICSGGRYDNLAQNYTDSVLPGVGISIGLTRLFFVLKEIGFIDKYTAISVVDYLIIPIGDTLSYCSEISKILQDFGYKAEIYLEEDKLKKKLAYANKLGISKVILIGEEELINRELLIKDMSTGEQKKLNFEKLLRIEK